MAVVRVKEVTGRDGERDMQSNKRYVRMFQVLTDHPTDGAKTVRDHPLIPAFGSRWESYRAGALIDMDEDARMIEKTAVQSDGDNFQNWMVTCRYAGVGDPTLEPPKVTWTSEKWQETDSRDYTGRMFANSAGELFESGLTRDRTRKVLLFERNQLTYNAKDMNAYEDTTNDALFLASQCPPGFGVGTAKIDTIDGVAVFYPDYPNRAQVHYWRVTYKISIDRNGWDASVIDMGFNELVSVGGTDTLVQIIGPNGLPVTTPQLLDGSGIALPLGATPELLLPFQRYESKDWSLLNITY